MHSTDGFEDTCAERTVGCCVTGAIVGVLVFEESA